MVTKFQPTLPAEVVPSDAELEFMELSPAGLFPQNQNSNFGFLIRKIWCDRINEIVNQQNTMFNEKFPDTSTLFLDDHERQYGLPAAAPTLTIAQRRQNVLNRIRVGPFTRTRRRLIVESFIAATFGTAIQITPDGVILTTGGVPLFSGTGNVSSLYTIVENIPAFSYDVRIDGTVTVDDAGIRRELSRITPAHISFTITYVGSTLPAGVFDTAQFDTSHFDNV